VPHRLTGNALLLARLAVEALTAQRARQASRRLKAGELWQDTGLVFTTSVGTALLAGNVRRAFRVVLRDVPGINAAGWTPRELRRTFVSRLSEHGTSMRTSPVWPGTVRHARPRPCTVTNCAPSSAVARRRSM
jgi:hypothetical protein